MISMTYKNILNKEVLGISKREREWSGWRYQKFLALQDQESSCTPGWQCL